MVPLFIFGYRETHIHTHEMGPHFKVEKYVNVNTEDVLLKLSQRNVENHQHRPPPPLAAVEAVNPVGDPKTTLSTGPSASSSSKSSKEEPDETQGDKEEGAAPAFLDVLGDLVKKAEEHVEALRGGGGEDSETDTKETNKGNSQAMDNGDSLDIPQDEEEHEKEEEVESPDIDRKDTEDTEKKLRQGDT